MRFELIWTSIGRSQERGSWWNPNGGMISGGMPLRSPESRRARIHPGQEKRERGRS